MRTARLPIAAGLLLLAAAGPAVPTGEWMTEDRGGVIRIGPCGDALCGTIIGLSDWPANGDIKRDVHGQPQCGYTLLAGLRLRPDGRWHGTVTNPEDGRSYSAEVWLPDASMRLRGYVGLPLFGSTQVWPRFTGTIKPGCHL